MLGEKDITCQTNIGMIKTEAFMMLCYGYEGRKDGRKVQAYFMKDRWMSSDIVLRGMMWKNIGTRSLTH